MTMSAFSLSTDTKVPLSKSMAVFTNGRLLEGHSENRPEIMDSLLALEIICGGGICSQKSADPGVLNTCSPGNENNSSGAMTKEVLKVGVAAIATVADGLGLLVTIRDWVGTEVGIALETKDGVSLHPLKARLQTRIQEKNIVKLDFQFMVYSPYRSWIQTI